jgi:hypothetical protein
VSRFIEDGLRCHRVGRSYYAISRGSNWRSDDCSKIAKIEFVRGPILDVKIRSKRAADIRCLCDPEPLSSLNTPIADFYPKRIKNLICCVRYYEGSHPKYGRRFAGSRPVVSIEDLVAMVIDAHEENSVRLPAKALRFDPRD